MARRGRPRGTWYLYPNSTPARLLEWARAHGGKFTTRDASDALGTPTNTLHMHLRRLADRGFIERTDGGSGPGIFARWRAIRSKRDEEEETDPSRPHS